MQTSVEHKMNKLWDYHHELLDQISDMKNAKALAIVIKHLDKKMNWIIDMNQLWASYDIDAYEDISDENREHAYEMKAESIINGSLNPEDLLTTSNFRCMNCYEWIDKDAASIENAWCPECRWDH
jgi:DNA-binding GntR family transcriptional regulator